MSSNIDDRTLHELYLWPFMDAVKANVASVMCSYNKLNGTWACENDHIMNKLLKTELGFLGYIMSDWNAQHTTSGECSLFHLRGRLSDPPMSQEVPMLVWT